MDFSIGTALFLIFSSSLSDAVTRDYTTELSVPNGGPWGEWGLKVFCPEGYAKGFSMKVDQKGAPGGKKKDETSLNGFRLYCTDGSIVQSSGPHGTWTKVETCPGGRLISFTLRVLEPQGNWVDDKSADNIIFSCENGAILTGHSNDWGTYGPWSAPCAKGAICGMLTRIEHQQSKDMTGLSDVKFYCCD